MIVCVLTFFSICKWLGAYEKRIPEIYLYLDYLDSSKFMRLNDPLNKGLQLGLLANPGSFEDFKVLKNRNVVFFLQSISPDYQTEPGMIYRQVFDDLPAKANWGNHSMEHNDARGVFGLSEIGRPIFRPWGAFHSCGPGILQNFEFPDVFPLGVNFVSGKKWYSIPNGSWYQSWNYLPAQGLFDRSFKIFRDSVETRNYSWWYKILKADEKPENKIFFLGGLDRERMTRFSINACLEDCGNCEKSSFFEDPPPQASFFCGENESESGLENYVFAKTPGKTQYLLAKDGAPVEDSVEIIGDEGGALSFGELEGRRMLWFDRRFNEKKRFFVLSNGVFNKWLKEVRPDFPGSFSLDIAAIKGLDEYGKKVLICGYDRNRGLVLCFMWNKNDFQEIKITDFKQILIGSEIEDIRIYNDFRLFFVKIWGTPRSLIEEGKMFRDVIGIIDDGFNTVGKGRLVFEQKWIAEILMMDLDFTGAESIAAIPLGESHMSREFEFPVEKYSEIICGGKLVSTSSVKLGEWSAPVPEYFDSFKQPSRVLIDILNGNKF
ncbi:MAG: hypothetical protein HQM08_00315 [Candidatus Riflebacteria bacterium]|nr:hypothetical protein [Candidatus Riflebacteria bacterium]